MGATDSVKLEIKELTQQMFGIQKQIVDKELEAGLRTAEQADTMKAHWTQEKDAISRIREAKEKIEKAKLEQHAAERDGDLGRAAELRYGVLLDLEKQLEAENEKLAELQKTQKMLKEEVDEEDIATIVSSWTGVPVSRMLEGETEKLVRMEDALLSLIHI